MRGQDWFNGRLATVGASYLAYVQWALALDPPPELFAMAVHISPHDLAAAGFGQGPFELFNLLMWSDLMAHQEHHSAAVMTWRTMTTDRRLGPAAGCRSRGPGRRSAGRARPGTRTGSRDRSAATPTGRDSAAAALDRVAVPTLLISGFHDFFVTQTMQQYRALSGRGVPVGLTVGPWTHMTLDLGVAIRETLAWLDAFDPGSAAVSAPRPAAVRVWRSGAEQWYELAQWPPPDAADRDFYLRPGGQLGSDPPAAGSGAASTFRYDPADPTPSVGGRIMSLRSGGSQDNSALEARADVLTFSTGPLEQPLESPAAAGPAVPRLR